MIGYYVLKTEPAREPIGLDDIKSHSRIDVDDDDLLIQSIALGVRKMVEKIYDLALITQTWTLYLDYLPAYCIEIFKRPVQKINSIKYLDSESVTQTMATGLYTLEAVRRPPRIVRAYNQTWPFVNQRPSAVAIEFDAGYGLNESDVPQEVRNYLMIKTADFYENRESYTELKLQGLDFIDNLIASERLFSI